jgi:hypothetical protein
MRCFYFIFNRSSVFIILIAPTVPTLRTWTQWQILRGKVIEFKFTLLGDIKRSKEDGENCRRMALALGVAERIQKPSVLYSGLKRIYMFNNMDNMYLFRYIALLNIPSL